MAVDESIYTCELVDGYPVESAKETLQYKVVKLREATVDDDLEARKKAEKPFKTPEGWKLLESQAIYDKEMAARQIELLKKPGQDDIDGDLINIGKFSELDMQRIHSKIQLIQMAAYLRHGLIDQETFDKALNGESGEPEQEAGDSGGRSDGAEIAPASLAGVG